MTIIKGIYRVADCEHRGDMDSAKNYLKSNGCSIISSYWDGVDCGEAYIEFSFPSSIFVKLYYKFGNSATYTDDINKYLSFEDMGTFTHYTSQELLSLKEKMSADYAVGFMYRLPLWLFFDCDKAKSKGYKDIDIINKCISILEDGVSVIGYCYVVVDGCKYCDVLLSTNYKNLTAEKMKYGIGDYCLGDDGFLKSNNIYGECSCVHKFINTNLLWDYDYIQRIIRTILTNGTMNYQHIISYYNREDKQFNANDYFDSEGNFLAEINYNGNKYVIKDVRKWDWSV